jgi:hypothetical protein
VRYHNDDHLFNQEGSKMKKRFSVVQAKKSRDGDKTFWQRHGVAFSSSKGISIKLESLPLPNEQGEVWLSLFEDDGKKGGGGNVPAPGVSGINDEIPF